MYTLFAESTPMLAFPIIYTPRQVPKLTVRSDDDILQKSVSTVSLSH